MTRHKYAIGQQVEFRPGSMDGNIPLGTYTIVKPLPIEFEPLPLSREEPARRA